MGPRARAGAEEGPPRAPEAEGAYRRRHAAQEGQKGCVTLTPRFFSGRAAGVEPLALLSCSCSSYCSCSFALALALALSISTGAGDFDDYVKALRSGSTLLDDC